MEQQISEQSKKKEALSQDKSSCSSLASTIDSTLSESSYQRMLSNPVWYKNLDRSDIPISLDDSGSSRGGGVDDSSYEESIQVSSKTYAKKRLSAGMFHRAIAMEKILPASSESAQSNAHNSVADEADDDSSTATEVSLPPPPTRRKQAKPMDKQAFHDAMARMKSPEKPATPAKPLEEEESDSDSPAPKAAEEQMSDADDDDSDVLPPVTTPRKRKRVHSKMDKSAFHKATKDLLKSPKKLNETVSSMDDSIESPVPQTKQRRKRPPMLTSHRVMFKEAMKKLYRDDASEAQEGNNPLSMEESLDSIDSQQQQQQSLVEKKRKREKPKMSMNAFKAAYASVPDESPRQDSPVGSEELTYPDSSEIETNSAKKRRKTDRISPSVFADAMESAAPASPREPTSRSSLVLEMGGAARGSSSPRPNKSTPRVEDLAGELSARRESKKSLSRKSTLNQSMSTIVEQHETEEQVLHHESAAGVLRRAQSLVSKHSVASASHMDTPGPVLHYRESVSAYAKKGPVRHSFSPQSDRRLDQSCEEVSLPPSEEDKPSNSKNARGRSVASKNPQKSPSPLLSDLSGSDVSDSDESDPSYIIEKIEVVPVNARDLVKFNKSAFARAWAEADVSLPEELQSEQHPEDSLSQSMVLPPPSNLEDSSTPPPPSPPSKGRRRFSGDSEMDAISPAAAEKASPSPSTLEESSTPPPPSPPSKGRRRFSGLLGDSATNLISLAATEKGNLSQVDPSKSSTSLLEKAINQSFTAKLGDLAQSPRLSERTSDRSSAGLSSAPGAETVILSKSGEETPSTTHGEVEPSSPDKSSPGSTKPQTDSSAKIKESTFVIEQDEDSSTLQLDLVLESSTEDSHDATVQNAVAETNKFERTEDLAGDAEVEDGVSFSPAPPAGRASTVEEHVEATVSVSPADSSSSGSEGEGDVTTVENHSPVQEETESESEGETVEEPDYGEEEMSLKSCSADEQEEEAARPSSADEQVDEGAKSSIVEKQDDQDGESPSADEKGDKVSSADRPENKGAKFPSSEEQEEVNISDVSTEKEPVHHQPEIPVDPAHVSGVSSTGSSKGSQGKSQGNQIFKWAPKSQVISEAASCPVPQAIQRQSVPLPTSVCTPGSSRASMTEEEMEERVNAALALVPQDTGYPSKQAPKPKPKPVKPKRTDKVNIGKLKKPASWVNAHFYKMLLPKFTKQDERRARRLAEDFALELHEYVEDAIRFKIKEEVKAAVKKAAQLLLKNSLVKDKMSFIIFARDYLPPAFSKKAFADTTDYFE